MALANKCDLILSWNFRHFVNPKTINGVKNLSKINNLPDINILSPNSFMILYEEGLIV